MEGKSFQALLAYSRVETLQSQVSSLQSPVPSRHCTDSAYNKYIHIHKYKSNDSARKELAKAVRESDDSSRPERGEKI